MGNSGVPVRCIPDTADGTIGPASFFRCVAADGTPFGGGQSVPGGYYLLVTDVLLTPARVTTIDTIHEVTLRDVAGNNSVTAELRLEVFRSDTKSLNFTTPFLVLPAGHRLSAEHFGPDTFDVHAYVSGLLVTNVTYMPNMMRP